MSNGLQVKQSCTCCLGLLLSGCLHDLRDEAFLQGLGRVRQAINGPSLEIEDGAQNILEVLAEQQRLLMRLTILTSTLQNILSLLNMNKLPRNTGIPECLMKQDHIDVVYNLVFYSSRLLR